MKTILTLLITSIILVGCGLSPSSLIQISITSTHQSPSPTPFQPVGATPTLLPTPTSTKEPSPRSTSTSEPSLTPEPSPTPTSAPICPATLPSLSPGLLAPGTIIFTPLNGKLGDLQYFSATMDAPQDFLRQLPCCLTLLHPKAQLSPDLKWLALLDQKDDYKRSSFVITDGRQSSPVIIPKSNDWVELYDWVGDHHLLAYPTYSVPNGTLLLINAFTGEFRELRPSFPDLYQPGLFSREEGWSDPEYPVYNPSIQYVVYFFNDPTNPFKQAVVLWSLVAKKEIWRLPLSLVEKQLQVSQPVWSPDGKQFAILTWTTGTKNQGSILWVNRTGQVAGINFPSFSAGKGLSWSPDGRFLAFSGLINETQRLLVVDLLNQSVWDPCITGDIQPVAWSPDSHQFLAWGVQDNSTKFYDLVDVGRQEVAQLGFEFYEAAWLSRSP